MSRRSIARLAAGGFVLRVPAGELVIREDVEEREVYLILDAGRRTASVRSQTAGRLLVLRRRFLDELTRDDPKAGARLLKNLRRFAAARLA